jgi:exonuclease V
MASLAPKEPQYEVGEQVESDYGSDFSPEQEELVNSLLSAVQIEALDDNPNVNHVESNDPPSSLRVPRVLGREEKPEEVNTAAGESTWTHSIRNPGYPDSKSFSDLTCMTTLTYAEASSTSTLY